MNLLTPAGLWTLAALALPLALHLWRRPPRTVRLGSLRFLQSRPRRLRNLRWREYALLLARLGLLTLLALLLARAVWRRSPPHRPQRWALLDPTAAPAGPSLDRLRALQSTGYETHLFTAGLPMVSTPPADPSAPAPDLWSLLREADATLPAGSYLAVFSPGRLASLHGIRPALAHCRVEWINTPAVPTAVSPSLSTPPASPLTVLILHDADRAGDARYVAAACRAVSEADHLPLTIRVEPTITAATLTADWIFWLGSQPVPTTVADHAAHLFSDAPAPADPAAPSWIVPQPGAHGASAFISPISLWQRTSPPAGSVLWTDGFGIPLLTQTHEAHGTRWHFASRFHPAWNDLPLGTALPAALRSLLLPIDPPSTPDADHRLADPTQCRPSDAPAVSPPRLVPSGPEIDLHWPLWGFLALLFCLERVLSHRSAHRFKNAVGLSTT